MGDWETLSPEQDAAVRADLTRPTLVVAGPGAGKTRVLVFRLLYLMKMGVQPDALLAVTFTHKAAQEMKDRIRKAAGLDCARRLWTGTFHSIAARLLRLHPEAAGIDPDFWIADEGDQRAILQEIGVLSSDLDDVLQWIARAKDDGIDPDAAEAMATGARERKLAAIYARYNAKLHQLGGLDFGDLLLVATRMLKSHSDLQRAYHQRFVQILIDEFQDVAQSNMDFVEALVGPSSTLFVVGDVDQTIYEWRGARPEFALGFTRRYPDAQVIHLTRNYRSQARIVRAADALIAHNTRRIARSLQAMREGLRPIDLWVGKDPDEEAKLLAAQVHRERELGAEWHEMAILVRTHAQVRPIEFALLSVGVPYHVVGEISFWDRREIRDALAILYLIYTDGRLHDLERLLRMLPGIGERTITRIVGEAADSQEPDVLVALREASVRTQAQRQVLDQAADVIERFRRRRDEPPSLVLEQALEALAYDPRVIAKLPNPSSRRGHLRLFIDLLEGAEREAALESGRVDFREVADLLRFSLDEEDEGDGVRILTIHQAKGKEWPVVFIPGLDEGVLPHYKAQDAYEIEQERRLFYVALTRAKEKVHLFRALARPVNGALTASVPSRFIKELPLDCLSRSRAA